MRSSSFSLLATVGLVVLVLLPSALCFDTSDYDSYGVKLAGNDWFAAAITNADNGGGYINIYTGYQFPYNTTGAEYYCAALLDEGAQAEGYAGHIAGWSNFGYGVAVGSRDNTTKSVVWWGENTNSPGGGVNWNMQDNALTAVSTVAVFQGVYVNVSSNPFGCNGDNATLDDYYGVPATLNVTQGGHEEFYQLAVQPEGNYALGLANSFGYVLDLHNLDYAHTIRTLWSATTPPTPSPLYSQANKPSSPAYSGSTMLSATFGPRAVALETHWGVVAGWSQDSATKNWYATLLLFSHTAASVALLDRWLFQPASGTAQASVQVGDTSSWKPKHDISVAVRPDGGILLGIQIFNTVWLFRTDGSRLTLQGTNSKAAKKIGFGKTVSWTKNGTAAQVLHNAYSADYTTIIAASVVEVYPLESFSSAAAAGNGSSGVWSDACVAEWLYPGPTQQLSELVYTQFTNVISTPSNLFIQDTSGNTMFVQSAAPGYFQPTVTGYDAPLPCPPGMYNADTTYEACQLCPEGTYNSGVLPATACAACANDTYCPLGAVLPVDLSALRSADQQFVYPASPESTIFDDILIKNVFFLHGPAHCVAASPIFWGLIVFAVLLLVLGCMLRLKYCVNNARSRKIRRFTKFVFRRADLVKEGEHWVGGLISLVLLVLIIMGIWFTAEYLQQYPYETAANPDFACGTQYNAKFSSELRSVALPADESFSTMYDMLSEQTLTLTLDAINTNVTCDGVAVNVLTSVSTPVSAFECASSVAGVISISTELPSHSSTLGFTLSGAQLVGAVRLSISGPALQSDEGGATLNQRAVYASSSLQRPSTTLQKTTDMAVTLTKVINVTDPLNEGEQGQVAGLWVPVFPSETEALFMDETAYLSSASSAFAVSVSVGESLYWVANEQQPITRSAEAAFKTLLYIIMLLEVFGLAFLAAKLVQPCFHCAALRLKRKSVKKVWDKADSSDEEDWLAELLYGDAVKGVDKQEVLHVMHRAYTEKMEGGLTQLTPAEREERARARQERREAREGRDSARDSKRVSPQESVSQAERRELEMHQFGPHNPAVAATEV